MAKSAVGTIAVTIIAKTKNLVAGMKRAGKSTMRFSKVAAKAAKGLAVLGAATLAVAAAIGVKLVAAMKDAAQRLDRLGKTADKLGIATEELAKLGLAAEITGVSTEQLAKGIQRMEKNISDAVGGLSTAKRAFDGLGLSALKLEKLTTREQFIAIAAAMKKVEKQTDKVRIAQDLFGRAGVDLLNTLALGEEGLRRLGVEAEQLGLAISREDVAKVEAMNDAWTKLKKSLEGGANKLVIEIAPGLEETLRGFTEVMKAFNSGKAKPGKFATGTNIATKGLFELSGAARVTDTAGAFGRAYFRSLLQDVGKDGTNPTAKRIVDRRLNEISNPVLTGLGNKLSVVGDKLAEASNTIGNAATKYLAAIPSASTVISDLRMAAVKHAASSIFGFSKKAAAKKKIELPKKLGGVFDETQAALQRGTAGAFSAARSGGAKKLDMIAKDGRERNSLIGQVIDAIKNQTGVIQRSAPGQAQL